MNNLSLSDKKKLLGYAKRLKSANERREKFATQANSVLRNTQLPLQEFIKPTSNRSRNIVRQIERLERMMNYSQGHIANVAQKLMTNFPTVANMSHNNIIRNATESIRRHEQALRNVHSGRYQSHGRRR